MIAATTPRELAVAYTEAWSSNDMEAAAGFLADDVTFAGPNAQVAGKEAYLEMLGGFAPMVSGLENVVAIGDDDQALLMYELALPGPATVLTAERLVFRDGKVVSDTVVFDTSAMQGGGQDGAGG